MDLHSRYLTVDDLRRRARRRVPPFAWAYLDTATGTGASARRNRTALDAVLFWPRVLFGEITPDFGTELLGRRHPLPFGVAPVGQSGLLWPGAEAMLARAATAAGLPYALSNVANMTPEEIGPLTDGHGWFQLYPPREEAVRLDLLARVRDAGFSTLVFTVDVPVAARREKQVQGGLVQPPRLTPRIVAQCMTRPAWSLARARAGMPRMKTLDKYVTDIGSRDPTAHVGYLLRTAPDWSYFAWLREHWEGKLVVKGILRPEDATRLEEEGADAIWVSNHAGRQFDAAPAAIEALPEVRAATTLPILFDSGIEGGLDMLRAIALGADFIMLGRAWHYAVCALGADGPDHLIELLRRDLAACLGQLGVARPVDLRGQAQLAETRSASPR
ncbi:alpha-hydroxy acid oxidase [Pseudoponticoccus marisrubri]|uniref:Alpha-hydroxy-acid oxidizing enzyme n=1 Tax=Pseudoponticoccus marisrubri TaxID=1685382 RepID=A0A0W7WN88_9RHOB|nr:alpha-hydroxy acid oxidase [Pseudoponticoccus marisrubri]KUF12057.1 alpha-hydroxy-acid oxidizing enzyme [Pseudoponticoccus marisrubri]